MSKRITGSGGDRNVGHNGNRTSAGCDVALIFIFPTLMVKNPSIQAGR